LGNPSVEATEKVIASLEGGEEAILFGSGMAAVNATILSFVQAGDHVIIGDTLYGPSIHLVADLFKNFAIESSVIDTSHLDIVQAHIKPNTKFIFYETPANPTNKISDIQGISNLAKPKNIITCVDNTFSTPYFQRPLEHGADISLHSVTKYLNGHGDIVGGVSIARRDLAKKIRKYRQDTGACMSPFDSFLLMRGLKTLSLRMERHYTNTIKVFEFIQSHPKVSKVYYPGDPNFPGYDITKKQMTGYGSCISFELKQGFEGAKKLLNEIHLCVLAVSLGNVDTLIQHPASMTHASVPEELMKKQGLTREMIRISIGCEDVEDIIHDLEQALEKV
jgi:cystathionine beta-lyase/cystathionine gamma-synthase